MEITQEDLKSNNLITVFNDWENQKDIIGTVLLIKRLKRGLPFILKDTISVPTPEKKQFHETIIFEWTNKEQTLETTKVYGYDQWLCKIIKSVNSSYPVNSEARLNIRYLKGDFEDSQIYSNYKNYDEDELEEEEYLSKWKIKNLMDKFIEVNGKEIY